MAAKDDDLFESGVIAGTGNRLCRHERRNGQREQQAWQENLTFGSSHVVFTSSSGREKSSQISACLLGSVVLDVPAAR
jgi:hypothetical protein